jgi:hypothetical protein
MSVVSYVGKDQNWAVSQIAQLLLTVNSNHIVQSFLAAVQFLGKDRKIF